MSKKTEEFLLDTSLGEQKFEMKTEAKPEAVAKPGEEPIQLNISGLVPASVLATGKHRKFFNLAKVKGWYAKFDEAIRSMGKPKGRDIAMFFRLLSVMLNAGIPLIKSLDVIADQTMNRMLKRTIYETARTIERGGTLSGALGNFTKLFSETQVGMVRSGEASGQLNRILQELSTEVEKIESMKKKMKGALIYPAFIVSILILVVSGMLVFVVPKIAEIFTGAGQELPLITRIVIKASHVLRQNGIYILFLVILAGIGISYGRKAPATKRYFDEAILHIPIFGSLIQKYILARFTRTLSNLIRSGIPIIETLQIDSKALGNEIYRERVLLAAEDLSRGIPLAESLKDSPLFPPLLVQMIAVGEQTAQLDSVSQKVADYYEEEVDITVGSFTKILEPIIIVMVGASVGVIVAAIMLPMIKLISVAQAL